MQDGHLEGYLENILCFTYFYEYVEYIFLCFFSSMHILKGVIF